MAAIRPSQSRRDSAPRFSRKAYIHAASCTPATSVRASLAGATYLKFPFMSASCDMPTLLTELIPGTASCVVEQHAMSVRGPRKAASSPLLSRATTPHMGRGRGTSQGDCGVHIPPAGAAMEPALLASWVPVHPPASFVQPPLHQIMYLDYTRYLGIPSKTSPLRSLDEHHNVFSDDAPLSNYYSYLKSKKSSPSMRAPPSASTRSSPRPRSHSLNDDHTPLGLLTSRRSPPAPRCPPTTLPAIPEHPLYGHDDRSRCSMVEPDVRETIRQLEQIAVDLKAMEPRPRCGSLPLSSTETPLHPLGAAAVHPSSTSALVAPERHSTIDSRHASSIPFPPSTSATSQDPHVAIFDRAITHGDGPVRDSSQSITSHWAYGMEIPGITITVPSSDELAEVAADKCSPEGSEDSTRRNAGLWDEEPDELKWLEEYGQWSKTRRDPSGSWSDSDTDTTSSDSSASSLFTCAPETSSISTSPPNSPTRAGDLRRPSYEGHVRMHLFARRCALLISPRTSATLPSA